MFQPGSLAHPHSTLDELLRSETSPRELGLEAKLQPGWTLSSIKKPFPGLRSSAGGPEPGYVSCSDTTQPAVAFSSLSHKVKRNLTGK